MRDMMMTTPAVAIVLALVAMTVIVMMPATTMTKLFCTVFTNRFECQCFACVLPSVGPAHVVAILRNSTLSNGPFLHALYHMT